MIRRISGRPRNAFGAKTISLTVERALLAKSDAYAKRLGISRDELVQCGLNVIVPTRTQASGVTFDDDNNRDGSELSRRLHKGLSGRLSLVSGIVKLQGKVCLEWRARFEKWHRYDANEFPHSFGFGRKSGHVPKFGLLSCGELSIA